MGWECFCVVGFDLGPLLQGRTRIMHLQYVLESSDCGHFFNKMSYNMDSYDISTRNNLHLDTLYK